MERSVARGPAGAGGEAGLRLLQMGAGVGGVERAVRPVRAGRGDGGGAAGRGRAGQLLQGRDQARRRGRHAVPGVSRRAHRLRRVSPPPVRPLGHDRLLRHDGVLFRRGREADGRRRGGDGGGRRRGQEPAHRRGDLRPRAGRAVARQGAGAGRPPRRAGRMDDAAGQPVLRPQFGQPRLGALPRPRPGRAGGRRARHQPADQPGTARRPGQVASSRTNTMSKR